MLTKPATARVDGCDVVVVGAGLVGAVVAARLAREGFYTAILEARRVAGGATGRSAGNVFTGLAGHYNWAVSVYGREAAREIWALTIGGRQRLIEAAVRTGVPFERTGSLTLAVDDDEADALRQSAELLREDGFDASFSLRDSLGRCFRAVLREPDTVTVDAAALTRAVLGANDVIVHEGTEAHELEPEREGIRVWAQGRTVLCQAVVLALNGYAPLIDPYLADNVAPVRSLVFAADVDEDEVLEQPCSADYGHKYCRQLPDGRLLLGAWRRQPTPGRETESVDVVEEELVRFASRHFPEVDPRKAERWSEVMGFTPDGLPLLGALPAVPQVYFAVGFGGRGLSWAFVAAERLVDAMLHDADLGLLSAERLEDTGAPG